MGFGGMSLKKAPPKPVVKGDLIGEKVEVEAGPAAEKITGMKDGGATG